MRAFPMPGGGARTAAGPPPTRTHMHLVLDLVVLTRYLVAAAATAVTHLIRGALR